MRSTIALEKITGSKCTGDDSLLQKHYFIGILFVSCTTLLYELVLTRVLSALIYYHFTYLAISAALFGSSLGSVTVIFIKEKIFKKFDCNMRLLIYAQSLSLFILFVIIAMGTSSSRETARFLALFNEPSFFVLQKSVSGATLTFGFVVEVILFYFIIAVPFYFSGIYITSVFSRLPGISNQLYSFDLAGAGLACLLLIPLLRKLGGINLLLFSSLLPLASLYAYEKNKKILSGPSVGIFFILSLLLLNTITPFAKIRYIRGYDEPKILYSQWNDLSHINVYSAEHLRERKWIWGLSNKFKGSLPEKLNIVINNAGYSSITRFKGDLDELDHLKYQLNFMPYMFFESPKSLVIGPGGGEDVLSALVGGSKDITAVELNPLIFDIVDNVFKDFAGGIYNRPEVKAHVAEGRGFIAETEEKFDNIDVSRVSTWLNFSPSYAPLNNNTLYTVEAFVEFLDHLKPGGVFTLSRFNHEREAHRFLTTAVEAYKLLGQDAAKRIVILNEQGLLLFIFATDPFSAERLSLIKEICQDKSFDMVYLPGMAGDSFYHQYLAATEKERRSIQKESKYTINPCFDDQPFLSYFLRPAELFTLDKLVTKTNADIQYQMAARPPSSNSMQKLSRLYADRAVNIVLVLFFVTGFIGLAFLAAPFVCKTVSVCDSAFTLPWAFLFFMLGLGFMLIEIPLINRFTLFLGHPVYSMILILSILLFFSALGSYLGRHVSTESIRTVLVSTGTLILLENNLIPRFFQMGAAWPFFAKVLATVVLLMPLGVFLGVPFPRLIRLFKEEQKNSLPWAFVINGGASVFGANLGFVLALNYGFTFTFNVAAIFYIIAAILAGPAINGSRRAVVAG